MTTHEFSIPVHDLDAAGKQLVFPIRPEWVRGVLEGEEIHASSEAGSVDVRASRSGNDVVVHGRLHAKLEVACARCLAPALVTIDEPISALMVPAGSLHDPASAEYEFSSEEADVLPYDGDTVVLDALIRDELLLEIPMIPLCSEDCPGISPPPSLEAEAAPAEKPIDPRLAPLLKLSSTKRQKE